MNTILLYILSVIVILVDGGTASEKRVVCYYASWATYRTSLGKFDVSNVNTDLCTHIVYSFLGINTRGTVVSLDPYLDYPENWGKDNLRKFRALKDENPKVKLLIGVGGWNEGSAKYSLMAGNPRLRKNFISTAIQIINKYDFDGLDLDWEYPGRYDTVYGPGDVDNLSQLLKEMRTEFDQHGLILSAAVSAVKKIASLSYDISVISHYLDLINLMTYDMHIASDSVTGHNAPLHGSEEDENVATEDLNTVDGALNYWLNNGCPPEKLVLGIPLYGHTFQLRNAKNNGIGDPSSGPGISGPYTVTKGLIGYNELCQKFKAESWEIYHDDLADVPFAVRGENWVSYDDVNSVGNKIKYALQYNISGVMAWSLDTDDFHGICNGEDYPLLRAVNKALGRSVESSNTTPANSSPSASTESTSICKTVGYKANPEDCASFYYCMRDAGGNIVPKLLHCPGTLYWDQKNKYCNHPELVDCA